ncbi:uncharacterized protein LOC131072701 [Cryptomeria japonica]|uniref:uncharacterized protein LOC131072701 n=1 Tax=Cryptomeria japonica TaxID=3369 RepID=UPI0027DA2327|nr:uncharacterized protein LOC131072701 [Cryptomeria japonica]
MNTLLLNIPNLPCRIIVNSQGSGIHYKYIHADSVSLPSLTRSRVYPSIEKIVAGHRRPHLSKKHSSILLQAQTNNALTELNENEQSDLTIKQRLQELADSLVLPPNYLIQLPNDLRLDLNDAAFDLASGPMNQECGVKFGEILMQLSQAWEKADTQGAAEIASLLPSLQDSLTANVEAAIGRRLIRAGRRFASMGQYGQGELQKMQVMQSTFFQVLSTFPWFLIGHSLGRNKLEHILKQGKQSKEEIDRIYKIYHKIDVEELCLDFVELMVSNTRREIEEQWGLYDDFDLQLDKKFRARAKHNQNYYGLYTITPPGMDFSNVIVQDS